MLLFLVMSVILQHSPANEPVFQFIGLDLCALFALFKKSLISSI